MAVYPFLSPEWIDEARKLRQEFADRSPAAPAPMKMNLVVVEVPFGEDRLQAHLDTTSGAIMLDEGHLDCADLKVTVDYLTAKAILVDNNPQAGMQAFMAGRIRVEGDLTKLLSLQGGPADPTQAEVSARIREITA